MNTKAEYLKVKKEVKQLGHKAALLAQASDLASELKDYDTAMALLKLSSELQIQYFQAQRKQIDMLFDSHN